MDSVTQTQTYLAARQALSGQLTNLLNSFGLTLPAVSASGTISQSALNTLYATAAAAFPATWTASVGTTINGLLASMGYLSTVLMPLTMLGIANASGATNATVTTAVTLPTALPNTSYMVAVDAGQNVAWNVTSKTTTGFNVNLVPPASGSVAAGSFNCLVVS
jgi:hypothetical protein